MLRLLCTRCNHSCLIMLGARNNMPKILTTYVEINRYVFKTTLFYKYAESTASALILWTHIFISAYTARIFGVGSLASDVTKMQRLDRSLYESIARSDKDNSIPLLWISGERGKAKEHGITRYHCRSYRTIVMTRLVRFPIVPLEIASIIEWPQRRTIELIGHSLQEDKFVQKL